MYLHEYLFESYGLYCANLRVVSSTPDIVKSVEENKAEETNKSENNNDDKQTKGRHEYRIFGIYI